MQLELELFPENGPGVFRNQVHSDERGSFEMLIQESEIKKHFTELPSMRQTNLITGKLLSLRGFHASKISEDHWKIVTCIKGTVRDAVMDLRINKSTFGEVRFIDINSSERKLVVIPPGFAHAVQSLTKNSETLYATNIEYASNHEFEINPIDLRLPSIWKKHSILSKRDKNAPVLSDLVESGFFNENY